MKTVIIMGRGVEGCGVTKFTLEQIRWLKKNNHEYKVYASKDKSWTRKKSHDTSEINQIKFAKPEETLKMIEDCNKADFVIINSLPSQGHPEKCIEQFITALNSITVPVVLIQHDHSSLSINRNAGLNESIQKASLIFAHSRSNDFSKKVLQSIPKSNSVFSGFIKNKSFIKEVLNFQPGMDFESVKEKYWKDLSIQDNRHHKWIGRTTSWKGYKELLEFHNEYLMPNNYLTTLEGIEKSPAYLGFKKLSEFHGFIDQPTESVDLTNYYGSHACVFGPYVNEEMLERMSRVAFGYQLSLLKPHFIERSVEYTHCELVCTGTVPVFKRGYGEYCTHRESGKKLIEHDNTGTVWFDDDNMSETFKVLDELSRNKSMREEYRINAYNFYKSHQDSQYTFEEMFKQIKEKV